MDIVPRPTEADFVNRARANLGVADTLAATGEYGWAVVALFYAAVHFANALMFRDLIWRSHLDHIQTNAYLRERHGTLLTDYLILSGKGWRCRYEPTYSPTERVFMKCRQSLLRIAAYTDHLLNR